jgi:hypothetical protein
MFHVRVGIWLHENPRLPVDQRIREFQNNCQSLSIIPYFQSNENSVIRVIGKRTHYTWLFSSLVLHCGRSACAFFSSLIYVRLRSRAVWMWLRHGVVLNVHRSKQSTLETHICTRYQMKYSINRIYGTLSSPVQLRSLDGTLLVRLPTSWMSDLNPYRHENTFVQTHFDEWQCG